MEEFMEYAAILVPLMVLQFGLAIVALIHVLRHPNYRFGNKVLWILLVCCVQMVGPILYFVVGRGEE